MISPLSLINDQCRAELERPKPRTISRIRIHPSDRAILYDEVDSLNIEQRIRHGIPPSDHAFDRAMALIGVPIVDDTSLVEGPVVEWGESLDSIVDAIRRLGLGDPTRGDPTRGDQ